MVRRSTDAVRSIHTRRFACERHVRVESVPRMRSAHNDCAKEAHSDQWPAYCIDESAASNGARGTTT
ncbi:hypothetical protein A9R05_20565 [Burkholderia sp. KK1]|nr:hypothetical protein A9R05_20565 [Burkholderia sp. KK1]